MTWTPVVDSAESWSSEQTIRTFSPGVFSHAYYNGKRVFSFGTEAGIWDSEGVSSSNWVPE